MASQAFSQFIITDGTTIIDLLELNKYGFGIGIDSYQPGRPQLKSGGVWQDSPFTSGRQLAYSTKQNVSDAVTLRFSYRSRNEIIQAQETLDLMIEKALAYWGTDWQDDPIYIKAQALGETNARYALIYNMSFGEYQDPFSEPFAHNGPPPYVADGMILGIERGPWLENAPGTGTAISFFHEKHTDEAETGIYIANMRNGGLSHIYTYSGSFGSNLLSSSLPYNLFAATIAVGSIVYFGSSYPFFGLVFNLSTAFSATAVTFVWEFSAGGGSWTTFTPASASVDDFGQTGVFTTRWASDPTWATDTVNSVSSKYWIRARISALTGSATAPVQQTRHVYSASVPYAKVLSTEVDGTLDALLKLNLYVASADIANQVVTNTYIGIRSYDRGANFTAFLNVRTADNPTGVSVTIPSAVLHTNPGVETADSETPAGYLISYTGATNDELDQIFRVVFANSVADQFYGRYRLFARINFTDLTGTTYLQYRTAIGVTGAGVERSGPLRVTPSVASSQTYFLMDLGHIQLPSSNLIKASESTGGFSIRIYANTPDTKVVEFVDLFLLPVDEWSATIAGQTIFSASIPILTADSITYPKYHFRALQLNGAGSSVDAFLSASTNSSALLHVNTTQSIWVLQGTSSFNNPPNGYLSVMNEVRGYRQQQYHNLRSA